MAFTVSPVAPGELTAACRMLFVSSGDAESFTARGIDPNGMFVAKDARGTIRGAVLVQALRGAGGLIVPPRVLGGSEHAAVEDALAAAACAWLRSQGVTVCQAFASEDERPSMMPLERGGFQRVTQLSNMRREIDQNADRFAADKSLEREYYSPRLRAEFIRVLMATYDGTLDCSELNGLRTPEEVFDGFTPEPGRSAGPWLLVKSSGQSVGVVMLDRAGEAEAWEVAYLGLIPAARGRGLGEKLVRFALNEAAVAGVRALSLSVDVRNEPAIRCYRRNGFVECDRQDVYLAIWGTSRAV
jgi:mycothiol synthase